MCNNSIIRFLASALLLITHFGAMAERFNETDTWVEWHDAIVATEPTQPWQVRLFQSADREGVFMFHPYSNYFNNYWQTARNSPYSLDGWIILDVNNPQRIILEKYARDNDGMGPWFVQNVPECDYSGSTYGRISGHTIIFPEVSVGLTSRTPMWNSFPHKIVFPERIPGINHSDSGIFLGLTTFNKTLGFKDIELLDQYSVDDFISFVDNAQKDVYTLLYYAVDESIGKMKSYNYPADLSAAVLVTFTDGYDRGSIDKKPQYLYADDYAKDIQQKIGSTFINGQQLQSFSIGLQGSIDVDDDERFISSLLPLASAPENAMTVTDMKSLEEELSGIAEDLVKTSTESQFSVSISGIDHNARIRLTLDGASTNPNESNFFVEGIYDRIFNQLTNVEYHGFTSTSGETVQGVKADIATTFTFNDCRTDDGSLFEVDPVKFDHWTALSATSWQHNEEIERDKDLKVEEIHKSIAVMFAIDCSDSIGDKFNDLKSACKTFINLLAQAANTESSINPGILYTPNSPTKYYDITGREVSNPSHGLYIRRCGSKSEKIIL